MTVNNNPQNNNPQIDPRATYAVGGPKADSKTTSAVDALAAELAKAGVPEGRYELALDSKGEVQLVNFEGVDKPENSKRSSLLNRFVNYVKTPEFKRAALKASVVVLGALAAAGVASALSLGTAWIVEAAIITAVASAIIIEVGTELYTKWKQKKAVDEVKNKTIKQLENKENTEKRAFNVFSRSRINNFVKRNGIVKPKPTTTPNNPIGFLNAYERGNLNSVASERRVSAVSKLDFVPAELPASNDGIATCIQRNGIVAPKPTTTPNNPIAFLNAHER